jgi:flagellar hook-length control protein FliK
MMEAINIANTVALPSAAAATGADKTPGGAAESAAGFGSLLTQQLKQMLGQDHVPGKAIGAGEVSLMDLLKAGAAATPGVSTGEAVSGAVAASTAASAKGVDVDLLQRISALVQGVDTPSDALKQLLAAAQASSDGGDVKKLPAFANADAKAASDEAVRDKLLPSVETVDVAASTLLRAVGKKDDIAEKDGKKLPPDLPVDADAKSDPVVDNAALAAMVGAQIVPQVKPPVPQANNLDVEKNLAEDKRPVALDSVLNKPPSTQALQAPVEVTSKSAQDTASGEPQVNPQSFAALLTERTAANVAQATIPTLEVPQRVESSGWGSAVGDKVVWMVGSQNQSAELRLNPPSLGPLEVHVSMNDGQATLSFVTPHGPVREAIEAATPRLREMLGDSGISLGGVSVNLGNFTQQQSPSQEQAQQKPVPGYWAGAGNESENGSYTAPVVTSVRYLRDGGMVDLFA